MGLTGRKEIREDIFDQWSGRKHLNWSLKDEKNPGVRKHGGKWIQAEGTASAKALRWSQLGTVKKQEGQIGGGVPPIAQWPSSRSPHEPSGDPPAWGSWPRVHSHGLVC